MKALHVVCSVLAIVLSASLPAMADSDNEKISMTCTMKTDLDQPRGDTELKTVPIHGGTAVIEWTTEKYELSISLYAGQIEIQAINKTSNYVTVAEGLGMSSLKIIGREDSIYDVLIYCGLDSL